MILKQDEEEAERIKGKTTQGRGSPSESESEEAIEGSDDHGEEQKPPQAEEDNNLGLTDISAS